MKSRRIILFLESLIIPVIFTLLVIIITRTEEGGGGRGRGSQLIMLGDLTGFLALYSLLIVVLIGIPFSRNWISKKLKVKGRETINLHCDLATFVLIISIIHVIILSFTNKWNEYFSFYNIYPKVFLPIDEFFSKNLGLTFGVWALFFMILAGISGYFKAKMYKAVGRRIFLITQDITIISLIIVVLHSWIDGRITSENLAIFIINATLVAIVLSIWLIDQGLTIKKNCNRRNRNKQKKSIEA